MSGRLDVLVVAGEPLWPASHGGRIRTARIAEQLAGRLAVGVAAPAEGCPPDGLEFSPLGPEMPAGPLAATLSSAPRLGRALLGPRRRQEVARLLETYQPRTLLFATSYLASHCPTTSLPAVVDFPDVQVLRMRSLASAGSVRSRTAFGVEALKARRWEPQVARRAALSTATSPTDVELLATWGGRPLLVPNGADAVDLPPSPARAPVTLVAGFGYRPNQHGARFVLDEVWPRLQRAGPGLRLRLVGRGAAEVPLPDAGAERIEVVSDPDDVSPFYEDASVVLAPAGTGGGTQVKVAEALARGRVVVATPFSARSAPPAAGPGVVVAASAADFAACVLRLWRDLAERRERERYLAAHRCVPSWEEACTPLVDALAQAVRRR